MAETDNQNRTDPQADSKAQEAAEPVTERMTAGEDLQETSRLPTPPRKDGAGNGNDPASGQKGDIAGDDPPSRPKASRVRTSEKKRQPIFRVALALLLLAGILMIVVSSRGGDEKNEGKTAAGRSKDSTAEKKEADKKLVKIGEPVELANLEGTVLRVNRNLILPEPAPKPPEGQKYFAVEFRLKNRDDRAVTITAKNQFKLKDSGETKYEVSNAASPQPRFPDGVVAPGQTVQGWIAFEIPANAEKLRLLFNARVPRS